jgi:uncharacterized membrane protein YsdA (DUF1294 family)
MNIDTFFLLGFRANLQLLAILMSAFDKLVAKRVFFFRQFQRVPEHSTSVSEVWLCLLVSLMHLIRSVFYVFCSCFSHLMFFTSHVHVFFLTLGAAYYLVSFLGGSPSLFLSFSILGHKTSYKKRSFRRNVLIYAILASALKFFGLV